MEKKNNKKETQDFMNVESFSELPFIPPSPIKEKGIHLFGKEFGGGDSATTSTINLHSAQNIEEDTTKEFENGDNNNNRRFECHYCSRKFPTSQALGGHQNAHKRDQHAKRHHHNLTMQHHNSIYSSDIYGYFNCRLPSSAPTPSMAAAYTSTTNSNIINNSSNSFRFSQPPLINGSPLGLWRIPERTQSNSYRDRSSMHLFASDELKPTSSHVVVEAVGNYRIIRKRIGVRTSGARSDFEVRGGIQAEEVEEGSN